MTENMLQHVCSNTIPDYQTSVVLNETIELLLELNQVPQIPHISNRLNKKRKKNSLSKSGENTQKKIKPNQDDYIDINDNNSISFSTINTDVVMKQMFMASETGEINTNSVVLSNEEIWYNNFNKVKEYIDNNKKKPTESDRRWICLQQANYKNKKAIMKDENIYSEWTNFINKYQEYFLSNEEIWYNNLIKIKEYIDENGKRPSQYDKHKEIKQLGCWLSNQQKKYKKKKQIMKDEDIYCEWTNFMNEYKEYIKSNSLKSNKKYYYNIWYNNLNKVKEYIDENSKRPSKHDKDIKIKQLGCWISCQQQNYKNKETIMKNKEIYSEFTNFINDYEKYFLSNEEIWYDTFNNLKNYIDKNKKRPSNSDKDIEIKQLAKWICLQQTNYKTKKHIMKDENIYSEWTNFMNEYQKKLKSNSLKSNKEIWYNTLNKVKEYIDNNKKKPSNSDKDIEIKQLAKWIGTQQTNYKTKKQTMKNENIYSEWTNFTNDYKEYIKSYQEYLLSNEEIWYNSLNKVKEFIDNNKKRPSNNDEDIEIKSLSSWIYIQQNKYNYKKHIMKNEDIYCEWTNFVNDYQEYFN